jgi:NAD(P)-dependent dehydrogenase (short-subunit alcohol dehydrogenase family)
VPVASLSGRRCFVTGAASGIGRATALAAARQGADLYLTDIDAAGLERAAAEIGRAGRVAPPYELAMRLANRQLTKAAERA